MTKYFNRMMLVAFAIWEEFIDTDRAYLVQIAHEHSIVLICRPKISHFHVNRFLK